MCLHYRHLSGKLPNSPVHTSWKRRLAGLDSTKAAKAVLIPGVWGSEVTSNGTHASPPAVSALPDSVVSAPLTFENSLAAMSEVLSRSSPSLIALRCQRGKTHLPQRRMHARKKRHQEDAKR
mmetsp:Transcript_36140/g.84689  ORF Transcript_36140/g.84689 Transcript_36140/m.84689 type:complete len:122 (-) Transcript_36140:997-1362(-)